MCGRDWSSGVCCVELVAGVVVAVGAEQREVRGGRGVGWRRDRVDGEDRESVVEGKSGDLGGGRIIKKKKQGTGGGRESGGWGGAGGRGVVRGQRSMGT